VKSLPADRWYEPEAGRAERGHILECVGVALANIDRDIAAIKDVGLPPAAAKMRESRTWKSGRSAGDAGRGPGASQPGSRRRNRAALASSRAGYRMTESKGQGDLEDAP